MSRHWRPALNPLSASTPDRHCDPGDGRGKQSGTEPLTQRAAYGLATVLIIILAASRLWFIPGQLSPDPNEGWNAYQAAHALGAAPLYPPPGALTGNNYPPLSFYLVGWAGRVLGGPIIAGRLIALAAMLAVAAGIFAAIRRFTGAASPAPAIGTLLFLGFNVTLFRPYLAMDDPQWLGHALMTAGLLILIPRHAGAAPNARAAAAAALLMLAGGLVKQNLLAFPLAATLWLALHHRGTLALWIAAAAAGMALAAGLCGLAYGAAFFADVLFTPRHYAMLRMVLKAAPIIAAFLPLIAVAATLLRDRAQDPRLDLLLLAAGLAVPLGVIQRSGQGVDINAHFESLIALCIAAGVALHQAPAGRGWARPLPWLILPFLALAPISLVKETAEFTTHTQATAAWVQMQDRIAATPGPVACETLALCYDAGKPFALDFFLTGQRIAATHDAGTLASVLSTHQFKAIELDRPTNRTAKPGQIGNPVLPLIGRYYRTVFVGLDGRLLLSPVS